MKKLNKTIFIVVIVVFLSIMIYKIYNTLTKEGMQQWSDDTENKFLIAMNKNNQLNPGGTTIQNVKELEKNVSEEDAQYYIKNGEFKYDNGWAGSVTDSLASGFPLDLLKKPSISITREGRLVTPINVEQAKKLPNTPSCRIDTNGNLVGNSMYMIDKDGNDNPVANTDLPSEISGFLFMNSPCNPCDLLSPKPLYNCPFTLKDASGNKAPTSSVLQYIWKVGKYLPSSSSTSSSIPSSGSSSGYSFGF